MSSPELFNDGGLVVFRGAIDQVLAADFQAEWLEALPHYRDNLLYDPVEGRSNRYFGAGFIISDLYAGGLLPSYGGVILPATDRILKKWNSNRDAAVTVNHQAADTAQHFHRDRKTRNDQAVVIHGGDYGAFDYSPSAESEESAEAEHNTIELSAGDVVLHRSPYIFHRGRNTGTATRISAVLSTFYLDRHLSN